jgi:hypothetical protein
MGLGWFLGTAGYLIFERFVFSNRVRFASDLDQAVITLTTISILIVCVVTLAKRNSENGLSIIKLGSGSEARERVNRSSPVVKEQ